MSVLIASCSGSQSEIASDGHDHDHGAVSGSFALAANAGGYLVVPARTEFEAGLRNFELTIIGRDGMPQESFDVSHEEKMHLLLVSHDMQRYLHLHPEMSPEGKWSVMAELSHEGPWRAVADFVPSGGENTLLGFDIQVGSQQFVPGPAPESEIRVSRVGAYEAVLEGETAHERDMPLRISINRNGAPVEANQVTEWMGADAHMVAFMTHPDETELNGMDARNAFQHMHPNGPISQGSLTFTAPPTPHGWWQMFVDTIIDGEKMTFRFRVYAP